MFEKGKRSEAVGGLKGKEEAKGGKVSKIRK